MALKGNKDGTWYDASAVYGKSGGSWVYAQSAWAKKDGSWQRAWTDCRQHDAGGSGWTATDTTSTCGANCVQGTCASRETRTQTTYSKTGCTDYVRYGSWTSSPDCGSLPSGYSSNTCWTVQSNTSGTYETLGGQRYLWGSDFLGFEYYVYKVDSSNNLTELGLYGCAPTCARTYYIYKCGSTYSTNIRGCQC